MKYDCRFTALAVFLISMAAAGFFSTADAFEVNLTGQVNQLIMWADNGNDSDFFIADNDNSSTRFRFTGSEDFGRVKVGFRMEFEAQQRASNDLDIPNTGDGAFEFNSRWLDAYFDTSYGTVRIGKGDGAANNTSETDLSGTSVIIYSAVNDTAGDFTFVDKATGLKSGTRINDTRNNFDGLSRNERLRYDTPSFYGTYLALSATNGNAWEVAAFFANNYGGHKIAASAGYVDTEDRFSVDGEYTQVGASASWLAPFGLNLTGAYGIRNYRGQTKQERSIAGQSDNATNTYLKLGYVWGMHAIAGEYGMTEDLDEKGDESSNYGIGYVITPWEGVEFYAAGRVYRLKRTSADFDDISQVMAGTRIKF